MTIHIYSGPLSMFGAKVEIAAREKGLAFELVMVPFIEGDAYEPKHPVVLRVNPVKQQVPVLTDEIDGGVELFDSTQIFEYLEDRYPAPALWPEGIAERARELRVGTALALRLRKTEHAGRQTRFGIGQRAAEKLFRIQWHRAPEPALGNGFQQHGGRFEARQRRFVLQQLQQEAQHGGLPGWHGRRRVGGVDQA